MTVCFVCAILNLGRKKSKGTEPTYCVLIFSGQPMYDHRYVHVVHALKSYINSNIHVRLQTAI